MSFNTDSVASIDMLFRSETCSRLCPEWKTTCYSLPCKHCWSSDIETALQELDYIENPAQGELVTEVLRREKRIDELALSPEELEHFLARVCRRLRSLARFKELDKEARERSIQRRRENGQARRARAKERLQPNDVTKSLEGLS